MAERLLVGEVMRFLRRTEVIDYGSAFISGVIDGMLVTSGTDAGALAFLFKNIAIPFVDAALIRLPKGMVYHAVGQLGLIVVMALK